MVNVALMEGRLHKIEQPPHNAPALESASPCRYADVRRRRGSNGLEPPLQADADTIRLALVLGDAQHRPSLLRHSSSQGRRLVLKFKHGKAGPGCPMAM